LHIELASRFRDDKTKYTSASMNQIKFKIDTKAKGDNTKINTIITPGEGACT